jgi:hypothetical protein
MASETEGRHPIVTMQAFAKRAGWQEGAVADALGERLWGIRLDTSEQLVNPRLREVR